MKHEDDEPQGISRRRFLVGTSVVAATGAAVSAVAQSNAAQPKVIGPGATRLELIVNGEPRFATVTPNATLAEVLRDELHMTGTKVGCDRGACSACTVFIEGTPMPSCTVFALDAANRKITTIEGLAQGGTLHPVQEAFVEFDAMQCGFCTSGMVMSCAALLSRNARPTREDVAHAVSGNLCRCATYSSVIDATIHASTRTTVSKKG